MNPENNLGNENQIDSMSSSTLGSVSLNNDVSAAPVTNNVNPTNDLSSIGLESLSNNIANAQPAEVAPQVDAAPVQSVGLSDAVSAQPASINPSPVVDIPEVPTAPVNEVPQTPNLESTQGMGLNDIASAALNQNVMNDVGMAPVEQPVAPVDVSAPVSAPSEVVATPSEPVAGPTMPIPDQMPDMSYQAGVSTPVDYATPMSNFDEIGTTPELDPKAKMNKKNGKTALFALIILAIAALGAGSYYLINVKHIFDKSSVKTKDVSVEQGQELSENINDYATFNNTSSSNCVIDLTKIDIQVAGEYVYTIKCGEKEYTGKVTVADTKAPTARLKANVVEVANVANVTADTFVDACYEENCTTSLVDSQDLNITAKGVYPVKIKVTDDSGNASNVTAPLVVIDGSIHIGLIASKDVVSNDEYRLVEKVVVLYSDNSFVAYTMYQFDFESKDLYISQNNVGEDGNMAIGDYSGIPVYVPDSQRITLVSDSLNNLIQGSYSYDRQALTNVGYTTELFAGDHIEVLNY